MIRRTTFGEGTLDVILPRTAADVFEWRVFICSVSEVDPPAFRYMTAEWLARHTDWNAKRWVDEGGPDAALASFAERVCKLSEVPATLAASLYDKFSALYEVDMKKKRDPGVFAGCSPWEVRAASVAFGIGQDGPQILDLTPWAYNVAAILRDVAATSATDGAREAEDVAETMRILARLGLQPA